MPESERTAEPVAIHHPGGEVRGEGLPPLSPYWWIAAPKMGLCHPGKRGNARNLPPAGATHWTTEGRGYWVAFPSGAAVAPAAEGGVA